MLCAIGWLGLLAAHVPLLCFHASRLLIKPHYQFAVLVPVIAGWLAVQRASEFTVAPLKGRTANILVGVLAFTPLLLATLVWSPWLGGMSALWTGLAITVTLGGAALVRRTLPLWFLMAFTIPLPLDADVKLVGRLRDMTTDLVSLVLDHLGVQHLQSQNVIQLPGRQLFVADACSGIHSLFVLLAMALAWAIWMRRSWLFTFILLGLTGGLVVVENVARLVTIALAAAWGNTNLAEGWAHGALGAALFAVSCLLVMSTDQFLEFVWPWSRPIPPVGTETNWLTAIRGTWIASPVTTAAFLSVGLLQLWVMPSPAEEVRKHVDPFRFPDYGASLLPEKLAGFERHSQHVEHRVQDDPMGENSQVWEYRQGSLVVLMSLDYPYFGLHDAADCYQAVGWTLAETKFIDPPGRSTDPFVEIRMERSLYGEGWLLFSLTDTDGRTWVRSRKGEERSLRQRFFDRIFYVLKRSPAPSRTSSPNPATEVASSGPWYQVHAIACSTGSLTPAQQASLREFFVAARDTLRQRCRQTLDGR